MSSAEQRLVRLSTIAGAGIGGLVFMLVLFDFRFDPLRTASKQGFLSNFFDMQATALMHGRLAIPNGSAGIEGFVEGGKTYIYFPPFPALLRIPVQLVTHEFDGRLTLLSMALGWIVFAVMTIKLIWLVRSLVVSGPLTRNQAAAAAVFIAAATGGTVLTYDASLPWVYHEVYLWCSSMAVGAAYWLLRVVLSRGARDVGWLAAFVLGAMMTRTTGGWALALATMGAGAFLLFGRSTRTPRARAARVIAAGALPLLAGVALNYAKFRHPYMFPLENQVWSQLNAHRREALAVNGGTITGPQFLLTSFVNYFQPDGIRLVDYFPYITLPEHAAKSYGGAFLDQTYRTGSITSFMPLLSILTVVGLVAAFRPNPTPRGLAAVRWPMLGALAVSGGVMGYGYLSNRYTSDFVPGLVVCASVGFWAAVKWFQDRRRAARGAAGALVALTAFSLLAQVAVGSITAAQLWRGDRLVTYLSIQHALSGGPDSAQSRLVRQSAGPPSDGSTDTLNIVGKCEALYQNTGDRYEPWLLVERRDMTAQVLATSQEPRRGMLRLFHEDGVEDHWVSLEFRDDTQARLVIEDKDGNFYSTWFGFVTGQTLNVSLTGLTEFGLGRVRVNDNPLLDLYLPLQEWNKDWYAVNSRVEFAPRPPEGSGVSVLQEWGTIPDLCGRLAQDIGLSIS